jgi:V8-like Glu-specific endopeptidase
MKSKQPREKPIEATAESASADPPIGSVELDNLYRRIEKERVAVPKELEHIGRAPIETHYDVELIDREKLKTPITKHLSPFSAPWIGESPNPKPRAAVGVHSPRLIGRRGELVNAYEVIEPDDRRFYSDQRSPWNQVCRVVRSNSFAGSGVIVGPRHVLTASHVADWRHKNFGYVEVNRDGERVAARTRIVRAMTYTKVYSDDNPLARYDKMDEDYAVFITEDRIGDRFGGMGTRIYDSSWDGRPYWYNISYTSDRGDNTRPLWQRSKYLDEMPFDEGSARAMSTDADAWHGMSGSPMFAYWSQSGSLPAGWYVVAVITSGNDWPIFGKTNYCAGGSDLLRLVGEARRRHP